LILLVPLALLVVLSCGSLGNPVVSVAVLGDPQWASDFATTGKFAIGMMPIGIDSNVVQISDPTQVEILIDSTTPSGSYTVSVNAIAYSGPASGSQAVGLLFDGGSAMATNDPDHYRIWATEQFIRDFAAQNSGNKVSVADFGVGLDEAYYLRLLQSFVPAGDTSSLFSALDSLTAAGQTPLYTSLSRYLDYIDTAAPASGFGRSLVVLTDSRDTTSLPNDNLASVIASATAKNIPVYVISIGLDVDDDSLGELASATHGSYLHTDDLNQVFQVLDQALHLGRDIVNASFATIPPAGLNANGRLIVHGLGTSATAILKFRIPEQ
jgi:hypothetical protein